MSKELLSIEERNSGAEFYNCALQVNPFHYMETYRGQKHKYKTEGEYNDALIAKAVALNIKVLALTDHNHVGSVDELTAVAKKHDIFVFPGFEVESSEGVHLICIFEIGTSQKILDRYLGELGIDDTDYTTKLSNKNISEICKLVVQKNGITIAAHITEKKGLLHTLKSQTAIRAWRDPHLHAVQIPGDVATLPPDKKPIVENKNNDYFRENSPSEKCAIAVINCKDIAQPDDLADPSSTCRIKMSRPSIEGLRQAFLDPDSRIRLTTDEKPPHHASLIAFSANGGFLGDLKIRFNSDLNVLIGGRGAGKSTLLEAIRYTIGLQPLGLDAKQNHSEIVQDVIKNGTQLSLLVYSPYPAPKKYIIERLPPNAPVVKSEDGKLLKLKPDDILKGIEIFGQHEISELTRDPSNITHLLDRFVKDDNKVPEKKKDLLLKLETNRNQILQKIKLKKVSAEKIERLPSAEEELKRFAEAGLEEKLKNKSDLIVEQKALQGAATQIEDTKARFEELSEILDLNVTALESEKTKKLPGKDILKEAKVVIEKLDSTVAKKLQEIFSSFEAAEKEMEKIDSSWTKNRKEPTEKEFNKILKELQKESFDTDAFIELKELVEEMQPEKKKVEDLDKDLTGLLDKRKQILDQFQKTLQVDFQNKATAAKQVSKKLAKILSIEVEFAGDRRQLVTLLKTVVGGRLSEVEKVVSSNANLSPNTFVENCRAGLDSLTKYLGVPKDQAKRIVEKGEELFLQIEELDLPCTTKINLNVSTKLDNPEWKPMGRLSKGQKATALLLLLLQESEAPLLIDQPEDDLDNQFIAEGVVPRMRSEKQRRQFIFSTHNANLPVLGDAEQIFALSADGEAGNGATIVKEEHTGSIDTPTVQHIVEEILEGGKVAFETRRRKYGF